LTVAQKFHGGLKSFLTAWDLTAEAQTCLAHLIRKACGLAERADPELASFGKWSAKELERLIRMAKVPPTIGEWRAFYARLCPLIALYRDSTNEAGTFARRLEKEMGSLFVFLTEDGVGPTTLQSA